MGAITDGRVRKLADTNAAIATIHAENEATAQRLLGNAPVLAHMGFQMQILSTRFQLVVDALFDTHQMAEIELLFEQKMAAILEDMEKQIRAAQLQQGVGEALQSGLVLP